MIEVSIFTVNFSTMKTFITLILSIFICSAAKAQNNPAFSAFYEKNKKAVKLRWQHTDRFISSYLIQSSTDNLFYKDVSTVLTNDATDGDLMKFSDHGLDKGGKYYYRLKIFRGSSYTITPPVLVIPGNNEISWIMFPVPVGSVINLQYKGSDALPGVVSVIIQSITSGIVFTRLRVSSNTKLIQIPVANVGKGLYDIRVYLDNEVVWSKQFSK